MSDAPNLPQTIIIVGAGHAGGSVAAQLRQGGFEGRICLIGEEPVVPYQRPPLSKAWLAGTSSLDHVILRPGEWYRENDVDLRLDTRVVAIDRSAKTVTLGDGECLGYDALVLATGARPRVLGVPGEDLSGVYSLRSLADAEALKTAMAPDKTIVLIGAGYIGLEVAASARKAGLKAIIVEREARSAARVASETMSAFLEKYHGDHGVDFIFKAAAKGFAGTGAVTAVELADGRVLPCDLVLVGAGVVPNDELARAAGLECGNGIIVDAQARTSDPAIFAVGDVSFRPLELYNTHFRLESVPNALEQARCVAFVLTGKPHPAPDVPWFWSDQYDLKIQLAGLPLDATSQLVRGDRAAGKFAVFHMRDDVVRAVEAVNAPPEFMFGRKLIASGARVDLERLCDASISMKEVAL
ncbi:MAG: 3-phenylpropionate/trans-cinnamate dioxygenase ferredoxin reductase subunit [Maricaulis sp.]|jgi:3-phenylpropionate/trans-cinnamate dioxygenase ferredoxin reductase subunit